MSFKEELSKMKKDEKKAPREYQRLIDEAETPQQRKTLREIREQEKTHYPKLKKLHQVVYVTRKKKHNSIRARCFNCGSSLCVVNGHYYCPSCKGYTVQSQLNDKPIINKLK